MCVGVGRRNVLALHLRVGGCREEKSVSLVPTCGLVSGGEMCSQCILLRSKLKQQTTDGVKVRTLDAFYRGPSSSDKPLTV